MFGSIAQSFSSVAWPAANAASCGSASPWQVGLATIEERECVYRMRHTVYACEIGQHLPNEQGRLTDGLDDVNVCIVVRKMGNVVGFVSITPPSAGRYSIDKYFARESLPLAVEDGLYEVRLLTVAKSQRGSRAAMWLMLAALRWIDAHGGRAVVAIGRREVLPLYLKVGLKEGGLQVQAGAVQYHLLHATVDSLRKRLELGGRVWRRLVKAVDWQLPMPLIAPAACFHGGAFFDAIGTRLDRLERRHAVINADVLDAWFPPAPSVLAAIEEQLPWLLQTSPPTDGAGLIDAIAAARQVPAASVLVGAGSSDLIFRVLPQWVGASARVLLLDPTYGEYAHLLERVLGCRVERFPLCRERGFRVDLHALQRALTLDYDLVILVNPNSPTGQHLRREVLEPLLLRVPAETKVWVDETYVDFVDSAQSIEAFAAQSVNVMVCKSMSKAYALSGARVAYLCGHPVRLEPLRAVTPPWVVSLVAQLAAVRALEALPYYRERWKETATLQEQLGEGLRALGWDVVPGCANFLLAFLPANGPSAEVLIQRCRARGLFLRNPAVTCPGLGSYAVRLAVKDAATQRQMLAILAEFGAA